MTRWQYHVVNVGTFRQMDRLVTALGELGAQGWELVTAYDKASNWFDGFEKGFLLFKRQVAPGNEPDGPWAVASYVDDLTAPASFDPATGMPL